MGVTIYSNNSEQSFDMGYGGFMQLRNNIAKGLNKTFGEHYAILARCWTDEDIRNWESEANNIIASEKLYEQYEDILDFLFASDCDGEITHTTCKKIYDLIKDIDFGSRKIGYANCQKDYEQFKAFLLDCYKHRRKMRWC